MQRTPADWTPTRVLEDAVPFPLQPKDEMDNPMDNPMLKIIAVLPDGERPVGITTWHDAIDIVTDAGRVYKMIEHSGEDTAQLVRVGP